jgi:hypothetical protein
MLDLWGFAGKREKACSFVAYQIKKSVPDTETAPALGQGPQILGVRCA